MALHFRWAFSICPGAVGEDKRVNFYNYVVCTGWWRRLIFFQAPKSPTCRFFIDRADCQAPSCRVFEFAFPLEGHVR